MLDFEDDLHSSLALEKAMESIFHGQWRVDGYGGPLDWKLKAIKMGDVFFHYSTVSATFIEHSSCNISDVYFLHAASIRQKVRTKNSEIIMEPGSIFLTGSRSPCSIETHEPYETLGLSIPGRELLRFFPDPDAVLNSTFMQHSFGRAASAALWAMRGEASSHKVGVERYGPSIVNHMLGLLSIEHALNTDHSDTGSSTAQRLRRRLLDYIDKNLDDPDLTVESTSAACGISSRYAQLLMSQHEPLSAVIRRKRLEQCLQDLQNPLLKHQSITDIAFRWGFNSSGHFARCFRRRYGVAPRDVRA